jgi:hypothetical protein
MKRNLLNPISSLLSSTQPKSLGFLIPLIFVFCIGFSSKTIAQCTGYNYQVFEKLGVKHESLPFDWIFTTPKFVYIILKLLVIDKLDISIEKSFINIDE